VQTREERGALAARLRQSLSEGLRLRLEVELVEPGTLPPDAGRVVDRRTWE
jgi:hypothetical protein